MTRIAPGSLVGAGASWELWRGESSRVLGPPRAPLGAAATIADGPSGTGFRGARWDVARDRAAYVAKHAPVYAASRRHTLPGGYGLFWSLPRTQHWTACAAEDGGWEILDLVTHLQAQGKPATANRLKPMAEQWILARVPGPERPLGLHALEMVGGRVAGNAWLSHAADCAPGACAAGCFVAELDRQSGTRPSSARRAGVRKGMGYGGAAGDGGPAIEASTGGASRFFYVPKAKGKARGDSGHLTIKPVDLLRLLVALATAPDEIVLDPYAGTGTTGEACLRERRRFVGVELSAAHARAAVRRLEAVASGIEV